MLHCRFSTAKSYPHVCPVYHADRQHCMCTHGLVIDYSVSEAGKRLEYLIGRKSWARKIYSADQKIKPCVNNGSAVLIMFKPMYLSASFFTEVILASSLLA